MCSSGGSLLTQLTFGVIIFQMYMQLGIDISGILQATLNMRDIQKIIMPPILLGADNLVDNWSTRIISEPQNIIYFTSITFSIKSRLNSPRSLLYFLYVVSCSKFIKFIYVKNRHRDICLCSLNV